MAQRPWKDVIGGGLILFESRISAAEYSGIGSATNLCPSGQGGSWRHIACLWKSNMGPDEDLKKREH